MALNLLMSHTLCMDLSFPLALERQASSLAANLFLPDPNSGNFSFRIARFPSEGLEVVTDVFQVGARFHLQVTRFLESLRLRLSETKAINSAFDLPISIEISCSTCDRNNPLLSELLKRPPFDFQNDISDSPSEDHFFIFYTDSRNCVAKAISEPHSKSWAEDWQRLINRSYGTEHIPPRRNKALV